jgi:hypothetical protein
MLRSSFVLAIPVFGALLACGFEDHDDTYYYDTPDVCAGPTRDSNIDADQLLDTEPGTGAGIFVEYASGGHWHVFVSCDTQRTGYDCAYDVIVQPVGAAVLSTAPDHLESDDQFSVIGSDAVELVTRTDYDFDGFYVDTTPGVALNIDAYLDNACTNFVYWSGDGAVHDSAPSMPLDLVPTGEQAN